MRETIEKNGINLSTDDEELENIMSHGNVYIEEEGFVDNPDTVTCTATSDGKFLKPAVAGRVQKASNHPPFLLLCCPSNNANIRCSMTFSRRFIQIATFLAITLVTTFIVLVMNKKSNTDNWFDNPQFTISDESYNFTFGNRRSYCVLSEDSGIWDEPEFYEMPGALDLGDCIEQIKAMDYKYVEYWALDGRCRGLNDCPYEYNCDVKLDCISYDGQGIGVRTFTLY